MTTINTEVLAHVTGGVARLTSRVNDPTLLNNVTALKSSLDDLVRSQAANQGNSSMSTMLPMMLMMRQQQG